MCASVSSPWPHLLPPVLAELEAALIAAAPTKPYILELTDPRPGWSRWCRLVEPGNPRPALEAAAQYEHGDWAVFSPWGGRP
ncbi:hypothetical protein [Calidithermus terrae]|uniref:hypothetical protein n=1 Tax=Calidithermus terrae TaxID=1408545 RepID=UPI0011C4A116|nr:hypothetical protein [Calidithermus terrae]